MNLDRNKHNRYTVNPIYDGKTPIGTDKSKDKSGDNESSGGYSGGSGGSGGETTIIYQGGLTPEQLEKLKGIEDGAQKNQPAYSYVRAYDKDGNVIGNIQAEEEKSILPMQGIGSVYLSLTTDNIIQIGLDPSKLDYNSLINKPFTYDSVNDRFDAVKITRFPYGTIYGNYIAGAQKGGAAITIDPTTGESSFEVDKLYVRLKAYFDTLVIKRKESIGGELIVSPANMKCIKVVEQADSYRCYFLKKLDGEAIDNQFTVGTQAICQITNADVNESNNTLTNKYYWRLVMAVGEDYIDLSKTDCDDGSDIPAVNDIIVALGHRTDTDRQSAIVLSSIDNSAPHMVMYQGIDSYSLNQKATVEFGYNKSTRQTEANFYGKTYIGDKGQNSYINFNPVTATLDIKGNLRVQNGALVSDLIAGLNENMNEYVKSLTDSINELQDQFDGQIISWFNTYDPTTTNKPASEWTTDALKQEHANDTFTNISTGNSYKWVKNAEGQWEWQIIGDSAASKALLLAAQAQDTADGKRRVFITQPTPPYDQGDLWVQGSNGDILNCILARQSGSFNSSDWVKSSKYTDDTMAQAAKDAATAAANAAAQAQTSANTANTQISNIVSDDILSAAEKPGERSRWNDVANEKAGLNTQALKYNITTENTAYNTAFQNLANYLNNGNTWSSGVPSWLSDTNLSVNTPISGGTYRARWNSYFTARQNLLNAIASKAKDIADNAVDLANTANQNVSSLMYLKAALKEDTIISGGLIQSSILSLGYTNQSNQFTVMSGTSGLYDSNLYGGGVAAWYGGSMKDKHWFTSSTMPADIAKTLFRFDGSGYIGNLSVYQDSIWQSKATQKTFAPGFTQIAFKSVPKGQTVQKPSNTDGVYNNSIPSGWSSVIYRYPTEDDKYVAIRTFLYDIATDQTIPSEWSVSLIGKYSWGGYVEIYLSEQSIAPPFDPNNNSNNGWQEWNTYNEPSSESLLWVTVRSQLTRTFPVATTSQYHYTGYKLPVHYYLNNSAGIILTPEGHIIGQDYFLSGNANQYISFFNGGVVSSTATGSGSGGGINKITISGTGNVVTSVSGTGGELIITKGFDAPTTTGGNASGTWGINIMGNSMSLNNHDLSKFIYSDYGSLGVFEKTNGRLSMSRSGFWRDNGLAAYGITFTHCDSINYKTNLYHDYSNDGNIYFETSSNGSWSDRYTLLSSANYTAFTDSRYVLKSGDTITGNLAVNGEFRATGLFIMSGQDLTIRGKRALVGADSALHINYAGDFPYVQSYGKFYNTDTIDAPRFNATGTGRDNGFRWTDNIFGGGGDIARIYMANPNGGEAMEMTFEVQNDADDIINFITPANTGLRHNRNLIWDSGNDGAGSGLDADLLDGYHETSFCRDRYIGTKADYQHVVILLFKDSEQNQHRIDGTIYTVQNGGNRYQAANIHFWHSRWSTGSIGANSDYKFNLDSFFVGSPFRLVTCSYNGETWWALQHTNTQAVNFYYQGAQALNISWTTIVYYTSNTSTVNNSEINNSIENRDNYISSLSKGGFVNYATIWDNVASATKLQTARTLWGQPFDGTGDVNNCLHIYPSGVQSYTEGIRLHKSGSWNTIILCGNDNIGNIGTSPNSWSIHSDPNNNFYINRNGSNIHTGYELCNVNGNWGIGTISPGYKLHVAGDIFATGTIKAHSLQLDELIVQKTVHQGGRVIRTVAGAVITSVSDQGSYWRCYHNSTDDFAVNDLVFCQIFTGSALKRYWRKAVGTGTGYVDLSKSDCEANSGSPEVGDNIATLGNSSDTSRQSVQIDAAVGASSPFRDDYTNINSYSLPTPTTRLGNLSGITDPYFGILSGNGLYSKNTYLTGAINSSSGKIGGWTLSSNALTCNGEASAQLNVEVSGSAFLRINEYNTMLSIRNDGSANTQKYCASFTTYGNNGIALRALANSNGVGKALDIYGNCTFTARSSGREEEIIDFVGNTRVSTFLGTVQYISSANTTIDRKSYLIVMTNSSKIDNVYLPSTPYQGEMHIIIASRSGSLVLYGNGHSLVLNGSYKSSMSISDGEINFVFYDSGSWSIGWLNH